MDGSDPGGRVSTGGMCVPTSFTFLPQETFAVDYYPCSGIMKAIREA